MKPVARPNAWVAVEDDPSTQLTYAPRVHPAPLTVSVPGREPVRGSLVVVITNQTADPLAVSSIKLTVTVGTPGVEGAPLMPTTAGSHAIVSDTTDWHLAWPDQPVTSGTVDCLLTPKPGNASLAAGASVYVTVYDFQTVQVPSTSTVIVAETIGQGDPAFTNINVSTFPDGFYFDGLTVNVGPASALVPVAQVLQGAAVTLTWNSSVVDPKNQTVYWSSATGGQQHATPTKLGEWSTPAGRPLTSDTVFAVVIQAAGPGDEPLTASLATAVSVQNPALVAASASVGGALTADSGTLTNALSAGSAAVKGALTADSGTLTNALTAGSAAVKGALTADSGTLTNALTAGSATINGNISAVGNLGVHGYSPTAGLPPNWGGGVHTWDVYAEGTVGAGQGGNTKAYINYAGDLVAVTKAFVIEHPLSPEQSKLVHAVVEGPEYAVYYRGAGRLADGEAIVELPDYFEALTRPEGRTVQVTPRLPRHGEPGPIAPLAASDPEDGSFRVRAVTDDNPAQPFYWEVKAVRRDVEPLVTEVPRDAG